MAIQLSPLPFEPGSLAPHISRRTIDYHYGKHHKAYVEKVNEMVAGTPLDHVELDEIVVQSFDKKPKLFNQAGQAWNHDFYWRCLAPEAAGPSNELRKAIGRDIAPMPEFQKEFATMGRDLFGSGWVWLTKSRRGKLRIRALPNAESPLLLGETPLLVCDVWEHAYYLDYQQDRGQYLDRFWSVVNWSFVEANLERPARKRLEQSAKARRPQIPSPDPSTPLIVL